MASIPQVKLYNLHRDVCQKLGIGQATLEHRTLMGTLGAASGTGNQIYSGPGPVTADQVATKVKIWCVHEPLTRAGNPGANNPAPGRQAIAQTRGQFPAINDNGDIIKVSHEDVLVDVSGRKYRVENPVLDPANTFWSMFLTPLR